MIVPLLTRRVSRLIYGKYIAPMSTKIYQEALDKSDDLTREIKINYLDGKDNGIAVVGFNRPEAKNSFGKNLVNLLREALCKIRDDDKVRILILRSLVPKIFSAGADLKERGTMSENESLQFVTYLRDLMVELESLPIPTISAIDGFALGGGLEMALASDIRTAAAEAKMGLVETKWAILPGAGGTQRLPRIVGIAKAKELIFSARIIDGQQAEKIGLVNAAVLQNKNGDAAYQAALDIAREILPNGPIGVKMAKIAISKGMEMPIDEGFRIERECYSKIVHTKDRLEGLAAFAAKRSPIYRGI